MLPSGSMSGIRLVAGGRLIQTPRRGESMVAGGRFTRYPPLLFRTLHIRSEGLPRHSLVRRMDPLSSVADGNPLGRPYVAPVASATAMRIFEAGRRINLIAIVQRFSRKL